VTVGRCQGYGWWNYYTVVNNKTKSCENKGFGTYNQAGLMWLTVIFFQDKIMELAVKSNPWFVSYTRKRMMLL